MQKHQHVKMKVQNKEGYSSASQGPTQMASRPSERGERWGQALPHSLRQSQPHQHLDLSLLASRTLRRYISVPQTT